MSNSLPWYFQLREEAVKTWDYFLTDKLVYVSEVIDVESNPLIIVSKTDIYPDPWIELHFILESQRDSHFCAIIECLRLNEWSRSRGNGEHIAGYGGMKCDVPMLVHVPQFVEFPQMSAFRSVPTLVRLKRFHDGDCIVTDAEGCADDLQLCVKAVLAKDRKPMFMRNFPLCSTDEYTDEMVQRGPEISNEVSGNQADSERSFIIQTLNSHDEIFRILVMRDFMGLLWSEPEFADSRFKSLKVYLRPFHLEDYIGRPSHSNMIDDGVRDLKG